MFPPGLAWQDSELSFEMTMLSPESAPRKYSTRFAAKYGPSTALYCERDVWRIGINSTLMCPTDTFSPQIERHRVRAECR